ncbi:LON peptidase N-terminal domain and RING finger protein 1 [Diorhabda carinulata]|uniref:LON peptidase N-terminal domain and RING finger protein 1 n=1 Tax=Diorhabda carinulata TaxID=1163345 RepID=UPI0025A132ED|nr:LON peptidase N-terminal domain and RING finger protein 1 [Diorhabda carinulata]
MREYEVRKTELSHNYPDFLTSLGTYTKPKLKCDGRILRKDTERIRKFKKLRKPRNYYLKEFGKALFRAMDQNRLLFMCPLCRKVLECPMTVECGHTFCKDCIDSAENDFFDTCVVCLLKLTSQKRRVNVLVQHLVEKWRERNKNDKRNANVVPNTEDILGVAPRYHLRSGYAGLHVKKDMQNKISSLLEKSTERLSYKKAKRKTRNGGICGTTYWFEGQQGYGQVQETLDSVFREVDDIQEEALKTSWNCILSCDLECILCSRCILDPVTTGCGHTFCRGCLTRVLDHGLPCPLCMTSLTISDYSRGSTEVLQEAIKFLVPQDYNERLAINLEESSILDNGTDVPVFICTNAFPGVACPLYVYEPKYRLLARRCLRSPTKRFAMAGKDAGGDKFVQYGTLLEVRDAVNLEDGRFILTTVGVRRFKVVSRSEQDGYDTARINYMKDNDVPTEKLQELISIHERVYNKASKWIKSLKPKVLAEVERLIGKMPNVERDWFQLPDGPSWAWWLMPILPLSSQLQVGFLSTTSLEKRLRAIDKMLEHMKIRMKALERNTVACPQEIDSIDYCGDNGGSFDMPYNN